MVNRYKRARVFNILDPCFFQKKKKKLRCIIRKDGRSKMLQIVGYE